MSNEGWVRGVKGVGGSFVNTLACIFDKSKWINNVEVFAVTVNTSKSRPRTLCRQKPSQGHVTLKLCCFTLKRNHASPRLPRKRLHSLSFPFFFPSGSSLCFLYCFGWESWLRILCLTSLLKERAKQSVFLGAATHLQTKTYTRRRVCAQKSIIIL